MADEFVIFVGGQRLENWTDATLSRSKSELTGTLNFSLFMSYVPGQPVQTAITPGAEILVFVGGEIAFTGSVDRRRDTGAKHGSQVGTKNSDKSDGGESSGAGVTRSINIGPDEYTLKVSCRGKTKVLIDSSHKHQTTNMLQPTNQDVANELAGEFGIGVEWLATTIKLDKVRFRDGSSVNDELVRLGAENAHFIYETREGMLRVTDDTGRTSGSPIVLGENILTFSAEQSEDSSAMEIKVKGQRTQKDVWGKASLENTQKTVSDSNTTSKAIVNVQHYGDATDEALERRANFEANKRSAASKEINVEVFNVVSGGAPWDIGTVHYVEIPPAGVFEVFECTALEYSVDATKTLKTKLTLSPLPTGGVGGGATAGFGFNFGAIESLLSFGLARKAQLQVTTQPGQFPLSWSGPSLNLIEPKISGFKRKRDKIDSLDDEDEAPSRLPYTFNEHT